MLKLIVEGDDYSKATVVESAIDDGKPKQLILRGIYAKSEQLNRNKRKYHFDALKKEFERFVEEDVKNGRAFGDFEHPSDCKIDRSRGAVKINKIECDENNKLWLGEAVVMKDDNEHGITGTPMGNLLASYIQYGSPVGFSTRGCGEIDDRTHYVESYHLITCDAVLEPSCAEFCEGVLESKAYIIGNHGQIVECAISDYEKMLNASAKTYDLNKKREIYKAAFDTLLQNIS